MKVYFGKLIDVPTGKEQDVWVSPEPTRNLPELLCGFGTIIAGAIAGGIMIFKAAFKNGVDCSDAAETKAERELYDCGSDSGTEAQSFTRTTEEED